MDSTIHNRTINKRIVVDPAFVVSMIEVTYDFSKFRSVVTEMAEIFTTQLSLDKKEAFNFSAELIEQAGKLSVLFEKAATLWTVEDIYAFSMYFERRFGTGVSMIASYVIVDEFIMRLAKIVVEKKMEARDTWPNWFRVYITTSVKS